MQSCRCIGSSKWKHAGLFEALCSRCSLFQCSWLLRRSFSDVRFLHRTSYQCCLERFARCAVVCSSVCFVCLRIGSSVCSSVCSWLLQSASRDGCYRASPVMAATERPGMEPSSSGNIGWVELLSQQITGNCEFQLRWTESDGTKRDLLLTYNDHPHDRVVIYCSRKPDGAALRTPKHGFWRWHNCGGTLALQVGYSKKGTDASWIHVINMTPHQSKQYTLNEERFGFEASLETVETGTDVHLNTVADWVMSEMPGTTKP
jgi:hypothetical protein